MLTINSAIEFGKEDIKQYDCDCFVVVEHLTPRYYGGILYPYDVITFSEYQDLKDYSQGKVAFDFLDNACRLKSDMRIVYAYSKTKLIIDVSRETSARRKVVTL